MSRKSNISLSNRALFYPSQKDTFQQHEESRNSNVVKRDLFKQKTANSSFPNLPELGSGWPRRGLRYPRVSVRSHTFEHGEHPNQSKITSVTPPISPYGASARPLLAQLKGEHRPARVPVGLKLRGNQHGGRAALGFEPLSGVNGTTFRPSEIKDVALIGLAFGQPKRRAQQLLKAKVSITQAKSNQYNLSYLGRVFSSCSTPAGANFRVAKASRPGVAQLAQKNPEQHFGLDPKGATEKCCSRPSETQVGPEGLEPLWLLRNPRCREATTLWLLRNPRDISVQWLERLGFTFSPFAFIFGTTFFFAALASTLQKQDGKHWLETVSHTKLPGLTENKVSQMSSWVFLESVLSQYINRDNSLLVSTRPLWGRPEPSSGNSLSQDASYSAKLRETMPQTSTFVHGKPAIGAVQLGGAIEIQLSPIWSQHIKKDFLGVFPSSKRYENFSSAKVKPVLQAPTGPDFASLNPLGLPELRSGNLRSNCSASQSTRSEAEHEQEFRSADEASAGPRRGPARVPAGPRRTTGTGSWSDEESTPFGFVRSSKRSLNKSKTGRLACLGNLRRSFVKPAQSVYVPGAPRMGANSSEALAGRRPAVAELQKTLIWPWYQIMAYHSPNHLILPTWGDETIIKDKVSLRGNSLVPTPGTTPRLSPDRVNRAELGWPEGPQNNFDTSVERLRLEDDSIPSKKDSIYSKKEIHQDSLSARVLNVVKKSFYDYGLSIPGSAQPPILDRSGRAELLLQAPTGPDFASQSSKEERGFPTQSSRSRRSENFSEAKGKPVLGRAHPLAEQEGGQQELRSASRPSGALAGRRPALASEGLESKRNRNEVPAFVRSLNKSEVLGKSMQSSCQAKPNLDGVLNVYVPANSSEALAGRRPAVAATYTDQPEALRETNNSSEAGRRRGQVIGSSENSSKPPLLSSTKSSGLALIFRNIAIPKKSFWEYAHSISGYNFPELEDYEVADLLGKVSASTQSKVGLVTLLSEASRRHGKFGKAGKLALTPPVNSYLCLDTGRVLLAPYLAKVPPKVILAASTEQAKLRLPETFVEVGSNAKADRNSCWAPKGPSTWRTQPSATLRSKVWPSPFWASAGLQPARVPVGRRGLEQEVARIAMGKVDRRHEQPLAKDFTIRYTPIQLEQENKVKKAFKELGRDYSDYLKQPKDSLPALLISPSLEEDKQIEEEEIQRVAQEKAAAKAAAKRTQNEEEYNRNDSVANEEEFNITDLDPSAQTELRSAIEIALREGKNSSSNLEEEPLNDEEIEDSRFERLRFTREVETKKKEEDCRGLALSLPCRDSNAPMAGLIGARQPGLNKINDKLTVGQVLAFGQQELRSSCSPYGASKRSNDLVPKEPNEAPKVSRSDNTLVATQPKVSDRKHSFFGQRSFWPTRLFSQEERLVSAHTVNPYILYDQSNPWLIPKQGGGLPVTSQTKPSANCPTSCSTLMSTGPTNRDGGQLLDLRSKVCKTDDLQNLKNLQAQARLGLVRFVHLPMVEGALVYVPATAGRRPARASLASAPRLPELRSGSPQRGVAEGSSCWAPKGVSTGLTLASLKFSERLGTPATYTPKAGSQNRIYKPDPRLRLTSLESSISADWRDDRKVEASPFRVTSKERPYIVLPQLSEKEWQKSLEWQLKRHFLDEDTRLEPLVATEPYKTFKVKRIDRSLPWLTLEKPSFKLFQWPYKPVGVFPLLNPSVPCSISLLGLERAELERSSCWPKASSCPIPLASSFTTYSKDRSALSVGSNPLFYVTKKLFVSQPNVNTELLFEPPSTSSWFLIYRLFLALILKEVFKYIYRISLKDFFIRIINSDFGRTITSPEFRQSVQFEPFPEFYRPKNRLKDLIGIRNALLPLSEIIWFLRNNCRSRNGPHGVILLGPEGVDTTAIARAVAGEAKVPIIVQSLRALTLTHSHPQKRLEKVLLLARAQSPCVLFLDELDVIGQSREGVIRNTSGDGNSLISLDSNQFTDGEPQLQLPDEQATSQGRRVDLMLRLLTVMDGLHHLNGVVIITTSKNTATLDPALLRPGRFDRLIHLRLPNHDDRMELFQAKTSGRAELLLSEADHGRVASRLGQTDQMSLDERSSLLSVAELEYLSHRTENMGGADIVSAINYSTLRAIVNDTVHTVETLEYGLNCVKALKEKQGVIGA